MHKVDLFSFLIGKYSISFVKLTTPVYKTPLSYPQNKYERSARGGQAVYYLARAFCPKTQP